MTTAAPSTALVTIRPVFTDAERLALAGFLAGYRGLTREAYAAAGLGSPAEHTLISLLALNGLRASEAVGADIEHLGLERGHRTLTITRKGGKVVTIPLAPRTARAVDMAVGERPGGPVFLAAGGRRLDRHGAGRTVRKVARRAGITKTVTPHTLRHAFITAAQVPEYRYATSKKPPHMLIRAPQCGTTGPAAVWTGMPPTSSLPTWQVPPGSRQAPTAPPARHASRGRAGGRVPTTCRSGSS